MVVVACVIAKISAVLYQFIRYLIYTTRIKHQRHRSIKVRHSPYESEVNINVITTSVPCVLAEGNAICRDVVNRGV